MRWGLWAATLLSSATSTATPLLVKNAEVVRMPVGGQMKKGIGLRRTSAQEGWRMKLLNAKPNSSVEVIDITPGAPTLILSIFADGDQVRFDRRFPAGHVYLVQIRGGAQLTSGLVYLYPSEPLEKEPKKRSEQIVFTADERPQSSELEPLPKEPL
jgi:hypothetical protein